VTEAAHREKFERAWGVTDLPGANGLMIPQMMEGLVDVKVRGFYIFGENLANTEPDIRKVEHELASAEFLVVQDIFLNETTRFAHVVLPAAAWSENDGTFTNSERRVNRVRTASKPPGQARPNWWIFKQLAQRFGQEWASDSAREIWDNEVSVLAPQLCGIKYHRLEGRRAAVALPGRGPPGHLHPAPDGQFTCGLGVLPGGVDPAGRSAGRGIPAGAEHRPAPVHYHTRTQTGRCEGLNDLLGEETADISPVDARALGISHTAR
jgi:formate dehydrogenase major subunit